jgi:ABC-type branched-subunit amino acid transport system ATPase component
VFPDMTVLENLQVGGHVLRGRQLDGAIDRELARFPALAPRRAVLAGALSGGEQQQLALAKALMLDPAVLCIDELSLGLSPVIVQALLDTVRAVNAAGTTVVLVEQSLNIAAALCDHAVFLEKGSVVFDGSPSDLLDRGDVARAVFLGAGRSRG